MADRTIGELDPVKEVPIGDLPQVLEIYDDSLIPVEQQGMAMRMTGRQFRQFGEKTAEMYVQTAVDAAADAEAARTGAETARDAAAKSATNAAASETAAGKSKDAAAASQAAAKTSENNAETAQTAAEKARDAANTSETNAAASAKTATDKAAAASTSETNAKKSADAAAASQTAAKGSQDAAATSASRAASSATNAAASAKNVEDMSNLAESYAVGGTGTRQGEDADNAKYYYEQARGISQGLQGALLPMGTVPFAGLATVTRQAGYMYNLSDAFTTDASFKEGPGHAYPAGTNVYYTSDGYWDCLAGTMVTSVNGEIGDVEVTPESIGAQETLTGVSGQIVGFDSSGNATPANIGGRNLVRKSSPTISSVGWKLFSAGTELTVEDGYVIATKFDGGYMMICTPDANNIALQPGMYTLSFDWFASDAEIGTLERQAFIIYSGGSISNIYAGKFTGDGEVPSHVSLTFSVSASYATKNNWRVGIGFYSDGTYKPSIKLHVKDVKLEKGAVATDWTPAPEDIPGMAPVQSVNGKTGVVQIDSITGNAATATKLSPGKKINNVLFDGSQDITVADSTKVAKTGDTMTGDLTMSGATRAIKFSSGTRNGSPITFYNGNVDGSGIVIGDGGRTIIGAGESAGNLHGALTSIDSNEEMHIASDGVIYLHTNCDRIANRKTVTIDTAGKITAPGGFSGNVTGSSTSCTGNAATATTLSATLPVAKGGTGATTAAAALSGLGGQPKHKTLSLTLAAATWSASNTCTITATGVTASNTVFVSPAPASWTAWGEAGIRCTAQGANSLTFTADEKPTVAITAQVLILD